MFGVSVFLTTLIFPLIIAPQFNLSPSWQRVMWQPPTPVVQFVRQAQAKGAKGIKGNVNACSLNYCSVRFQQSLESKLLEKIPETGFFVLVDIGENKEYVFKDGELLIENLVSTGSLTRFELSYYTPAGEWKIVEKIKTNPDSEFGPYFLRLGKWDGKQFVPTSLALHGTNEPELLGKPASHGCIRHKNEVISRLFQILPIGTIVETVAKN